VVVWRGRAPVFFFAMKASCEMPGGRVTLLQGGWLERRRQSVSTGKLACR